MLSQVILLINLHVYQVVSSTHSLQTPHNSAKRSNVLSLSFNSVKSHFHIKASFSLQTSSKICIFTANLLSLNLKQEFAFSATNAIFKKSCFVIRV
jgi:hypothetical protein